MRSPDANTVLNILRDAADFTRRVGAAKESEALASLCERFRTEKLTYKLLRGILDGAANQAALKIRELILDERRSPRPGMKSLVEEHERIWTSLLKLAYPPEWAEMDIAGFAGSEHVKDRKASYKGDPNGVRPVVESSIALVRRYSRLIGTGDFKGAYELTDSGLRTWMNLKKFEGEHERAAQEYSGVTLQYILNQFAYVYADEASRKKSSSEEGWPKLTAKENRRARVLGFWVRDRVAKKGCGGALWIAEENKVYRIAKFDFWVP